MEFCGGNSDRGRKYAERDPHMLAIITGYWQFRAVLDYWLPAIGAMDSGFVFAQTILLGLLAAIVFGTVVTLAYKFLTWILE
jgi:hypothetical protein